MNTFFAKKRMAILTGIFLIFSVVFVFQETESKNRKVESIKQVEVFFGNVSVLAKVAETEADRERGLSGTESLGEDEGMLFVFPRSDRYGFWMKDMNYSIDILWMDESQKILFAEKCLDPNTYPKVFTPPSDARYVLEVPCGRMERSRVGVGERLRWRD